MASLLAGFDFSQQASRQVSQFLHAMLLVDFLMAYNDLLFVSSFHQHLLTLLYNTPKVLIKSWKILQYANHKTAACTHDIISNAQAKQ